MYMYIYTYIHAAATNRRHLLPKGVGGWQQIGRVINRAWGSQVYI